jgi:hypothetical protein
VKVKTVGPILFAMDGKGHWGLGARFADAWEAGKELLGKGE